MFEKRNRMRTPFEFVILFDIVLIYSGLVAAESVLGDESPAGAEKRITALRAEFNEAMENHDAANIGKYLDSQYQITTSNGEHVQGVPEEEVADWARIFGDRPDVVYVRTPDTVEVSSYYDLAAENGTWVGRWNSSKGDVEIGGKYFAQWRKVDGDWKIRTEVFVGMYYNGSGC